MAAPFLTPRHQLRDLVAPVLLRCAAAWDAPALPDRLGFTLCRRLRRTLGRCYPELRLVHIAPIVLALKPLLQEEIVCHEAAHLVVFERQGPVKQSHGAGWKALMRAVGLPPRARMPVTADEVLWNARNPFPHLFYEHRCPVCQRARAAWWQMTQWRCPDCVAAGLEGLPVITPRVDGELGL